MKTTTLLKLCISAIPALFLAQGIAQAATHSDEPATLSENIADAGDSTKDKVKHYLSDAEITAKVKEKFIHEKLFDKVDIAAMGIHVKTVHGVVHLTGKVADTTQEENAVTLAKSVEGVKDVKSSLKIKVKKEAAPK